MPESKQLFKPTKTKKREMALPKLRKVDLATTTNITSTYAGEAAAGYIATTLRNSPTIFNNGVTVIPNVAYKRVLRRYSDNGLLSDATCDFTPTTTITLNERILEPKELQVNLEFCKQTFIDDWESEAMGFGLTQGPPPSFAEFILTRVAEAIAAQNENSIWQGNGATSGQFAGFTGLLAADATVIDVDSTGTAITSANVISVMTSVLAAMQTNNPSVLSKATDDLHFYVSTNAWFAYITALGGFGASGLGANGYMAQGPNNQLASQPLYFSGVKVFHAPGMPANEMILARRSNLFFGTGLLADHTEVALLDMAQIDLSRNFRVAARFTGGVNYGFGSEIVYYWNAP